MIDLVVFADVSSSDRILLSFLRLHLVRAAQHVFTNRSLLRTLLLRLCYTIKTSPATDRSVSEASDGPSGELGASAVTSTPVKADPDLSTNDLKAVSVCRRNFVLFSHTLSIIYILVWYHILVW